MEKVATISEICISIFVFCFCIFLYLYLWLPVEALLIEQRKCGDHEWDRTGDDEDATDGAHAARHLTHA